MTEDGEPRTRRTRSKLSLSKAPILIQASTAIDALSEAVDITPYKISPGSVPKRPDSDY